MLSHYFPLTSCYFPSTFSRTISSWIQLGSWADLTLRPVWADPSRRQGRQLRSGVQRNVRLFGWFGGRRGIDRFQRSRNLRKNWNVNK